MKKIIVLFIFSTFVFGPKVEAQIHPQALLDSLYTKTMDYYFQSQLNVKSKEAPIIYVLKNDSLPKYIGSNRNIIFEIESRDEAVKKIVAANQRKGALCFLNTKISKDTIDMDMGAWYIKVKKIKNVDGQRVPKYTYFESVKASNNASLPTCRFVKDAKTNSWIKI